MKPIPYEAITKQLLIDHAARTVKDPDAPAEHVEAASHYLANIDRPNQGFNVRNLTPAEIRQLRDLLAKAAAPVADTRTTEPGPALG